MSYMRWHLSLTMRANGNPPEQAIDQGTMILELKPGSTQTPVQEFLLPKKLLKASKDI